MAGGTLVRSGPFGVEDEQRRRRAVLPPGLAVGDPRVHRLREGYEAYVVTKEPETRIALAELLVRDLGHTPTVACLDPAAKLQLHVRRATKRDALLVDVINLDFEPGRGFRPIGETPICLTLPPDFSLRGKVIRALSPDIEGPRGELSWAPLSIARRTSLREGMPGPMSVQGTHTIKVVLPHTDVYTLVVIE